MKKRFTNTMEKIKFLVIAVVLLMTNLFFVNAVSAQTNTWDGSSSANWNTAANWSLNLVPTSAHDVVIPNGITATITVNTAALCKTFTMSGGNTANTVTISAGNSLTVSGAISIGAGTGNNDDKILAVGSSTLACTSITIAATNSTQRTSGVTISSGAITVTGDITMGDTNDDFTFTGAGLLKVGGNMSGGNFARGTGTVEYYGNGSGGTSANQSIAAYTYNNLTTSGSGTKTLANNTTINGGNLNIGSGTTLDLLAFTANRSAAGGILTVAGTLDLGGTTGGQGASNFPTNFSTVTLTGGTVSYNNLTGGQTVYATPTYTALTLSNTSGIQTAGGNLSATTLNTTAGGTLNMVTNTLIVANVTNAGILRTQNATATPIPTGKTWGGIVQYDGAGQTVVSGNYAALNLAGSGTKIFSATIPVSGALSIATGVIANLQGFISSSNTLTLGGLGTAGGVSFGSSASPANFKNNTFFTAASLGIINVATGSCTNPTITLGSISAVCQTATSFSIPYTATTGSPNLYSLTGTGITAVTNATLPTSPIPASFTATAPPSMAFVLTVSNSTTGCVSSNINGSVTVNAPPTASATGSQTVCANIPATVGTGEAIASGSIAWTENGNGTITAGAATLTPTYTPAATDGGNTVTLTMTVSTPGCSNATATYPITVRAQPQVSAFTGNAICTGGVGELTVTTSAGATPFKVTYNGFDQPGITSGTPFNATPNPGANTNYTITRIEDNNGCFRTTGFTDAAATITVSTTLTSLNYSANPVVYCPGVAITANNPTVSGGTATSYSISPALPTGLSLNTTTGIITGAPTVAVAAADYSITATNTCGSTSVNVNIATSVSTLTTTPGARCGTGIVGLSAASNTSCFATTINWYSATTGGSSLGTGTSFNTPSISTSTDYFAEQSFTAGETTLGGSNSATTNRGLVFDLFEPIVLRSVQIQSTGTNNITISLRNSANVAVTGVSDMVVNPGTGTQTITLNWSIPAGTGYRILYSAGSRSLTRTSPYTFPETLGVGVITSSIESGAVNTTRYNFFYNWNIARTRVSATATVNTPPTISLGANPSVARGTTSADLTYSATTNAPDQYGITWSPAAILAGFANITNAFSASPITVLVPAAANAVTYTGTLVVTNASTGCFSSNNAFSVTLNKTNLDVTADNKNKTFDGNTFTGFTSTITGFINGEGTGVVSGTTTYTGAATTAIAVGTHTITPVVTGLAATNYNFVPVNGTLTIGGASITTADFRSKTDGSFSGAIWEYDLGGGNWTDAGQTPTPSNNISILHNVTLDQNFTVAATKNFTFGTGGTMVVNPTRTFAVAASGTADFGGKSVTFKSNAAGTGSLGQVLGTLSGETNVTVERYIPVQAPSAFRAWRLLSVPTFGSGQTVKESWQESQTNVAGQGTIITSIAPLAAAQSAGFDNIGSAPSLLRWNSTAWTPVTTTNNPIADFPLYFLYVRGDRNIGVTGALTNTNATTLRTHGTIYKGDKAITASGAFSPIPNLYPSAINFTGLTLSGVQNRFYTWDSKVHSGTSLGVYQLFDGNNGFDLTITSPGGYGDATNPLNTNTTIESGQAFFVEGSGIVTLHESAKINPTNANLGLRPAGSLTKIDSRLYSADNTMIDANVVLFDAAFTSAVDGDDAPKLGNPGANFAIETNSRILALEATNPPVHNDVVQFRMWNLQQQAYKLEFAPVNMSTPGLTATLEDAYLHKSTAVDFSSTTVVSFTVDANAASSAANRFRIVFKQSTALPITIVSIGGNRTAAGVKVDWKVAAERNIRIYEVERSTDGRSFGNAGTITATGNNGADLSYSLTDATAPSPALYYRIKTVGTAGDIKYSAVVKVAPGNMKQCYSVSPNPVENGIVNLQFSNQPVGKYSVRIMSTGGQLLMLKTISHAGGNSNQSLNLPRTMESGTYQVEIISPDKIRTVQKLLVNNK